MLLAQILDPTSPQLLILGVIALFVAILFTLIHFVPVEYPGLFVFALVVGACAAISDGLSLPIFVHVGFNATGLLLAL